MSLRSASEQAAYEDWGYRRQKEAEKIAPTLTREQIRDNSECPLHVARVGVFCWKAHGTYGNCVGRRMRAALKIAEGRI